jgi:hypothetical protein
MLNGGFKTQAFLNLHAQDETPPVAGVPYYFVDPEVAEEQGGPERMGQCDGAGKIELPELAARIDEKGQPSVPNGHETVEKIEAVIEVDRTFLADNPQFVTKARP